MTCKKGGSATLIKPGLGSTQSSSSPAHETSLYPAVKVFLERQRFVVKGESCSCDVVAVRGGEPPLVVITELKLSPQRLWLV